MIGLIEKFLKLVLVIISAVLFALYEVVLYIELILGNGRFAGKLLATAFYAVWIWSFFNSFILFCIISGTVFVFNLYIAYIVYAPDDKKEENVNIKGKTNDYNFGKDSIEYGSVNPEDIYKKAEEIKKRRRDGIAEKNDNFIKEGKYSSLFVGLSSAEAKEEYHRLIKKYHPDNFDGDVNYAQNIIISYKRYSKNAA